MMLIKNHGKTIRPAVKTLVFAICLACSAALPAALAASGTIKGVDQRPWIIKDNGQLKSETELVIENTTGSAFDAWVKISVAGRPDYMESLGSLAAGKISKVVHVLELNNDGDNVTFALYDHAAGTGTALNVQTYPQQKIRHWRFYVGHNSHLDIGYTDYQEDLKTRKWPGFWDQALLKDMPNSDNWPDESKVRLEVEGVYQLRTSLPVRSADWFETLRERLAQGRFAYGAALANNAHSNWGAGTGPIGLFLGTVFQRHDWCGIHQEHHHAGRAVTELGCYRCHGRDRGEIVCNPSQRRPQPLAWHHGLSGVVLRPRKESGQQAAGLEFAGGELLRR